ncbi:MAG: hypothetical protein KDC92_12665 [Bacteroidetes bacterium]|nr:hypothetical protein [Bacteroidota bacterium]
MKIEHQLLDTFHHFKNGLLHHSYYYYANDQKHRWLRVNYNRDSTQLIRSTYLSRNPLGMEETSCGPRVDFYVVNDINCKILSDGKNSDFGYLGEAFGINENNDTIYHWKSGEIDTVRSFYTSGALKQIGFFENGKKIGQSISYYENGNIKEIGRTTENLCVDSSFVFEVLKGKAKDGGDSLIVFEKVDFFKIGFWRYYNSEGKLVSIKRHKLDKDVYTLDDPWPWWHDGLKAYLGFDLW